VLAQQLDLFARQKATGGVHQQTQVFVAGTAHRAGAPERGVDHAQQGRERALGGWRGTGPASAVAQAVRQQALNKPGQLRLCQLRWRTQRVLLAGHALPFVRAAVVGGLQLTARLAGRLKDFDRFVHVVGHQPAAHRRALACGFARVVAGVEQAEHQARGLLHARRHRQKSGAGAAHQVFGPHRGGQRRGAEVVKLAKAVNHAGTGHAQVARAQRPHRSGAGHVEPREVGPDAGQAGLFRRAGFVALGAGRGEPGHFPGQFDRRPGTAPVVLRHRVRARHRHAGGVEQQGLIKQRAALGRYLAALQVVDAEVAAQHIDQRGLLDAAREIEPRHHAQAVDVWPLRRQPSLPSMAWASTCW